jgi:hypothetical protein
MLPILAERYLMVKWYLMILMMVASDDGGSGGGGADDDEVVAATVVVVLSWASRISSMLLASQQVLSGNRCWMGSRQAVNKAAHIKAADNKCSSQKKNKQQIAENRQQPPCDRSQTAKANRQQVISRQT